MDFNATTEYGSNNVFSSSPVAQRQNQQHQQFQQPQPTSGSVSQLVYQPGSYPVTTVSAAQSQNSTANTHSPFPTWSPEAQFPIQGSDMPVSSRPRAHSMAAHSFKNLSLTPRIQTSFLSTPIILDPGTWPDGGQKGFQDVDYTSLESEMHDASQSVMSSDEDTPIIHIRQTGNLDAQSAQNAFFGPIDSRRPSEMSDSTYSMASSGRITEEHSVQSEADWNPQQLASQSRTFSPLQSPRQSQTDGIRNGSRARASPVTHNNNRTSPYSLDSRQKRWSTGTFASPSPPRPPQYRNSSYFGRSPLNPHHGLASVSNDNGITTFAAPGQTLSYSTRIPVQATPVTMFAPNGMFMDTPKQLPSQSLFTMLPSHVDRMQNYGRHLSDLSEPPDLWSSLREEPSDPPEEDMNPSDPDMKPQQQEPRFPGDLYTPRWVRGHGNKREGYCGYCKPGRWLVLKNSGYWYDRLFTHGVCNDTGAPFQAPLETRPTDGNADGWEGLCGGCNDWVNLVSNKKKATSWFRHAKNCHTHTKVKDASKRRRNTYAGSRRHTISEGSDSSIAAESEKRSHETEHKATNSVATIIQDTNFVQGRSENLERKGNSDNSAAVSPRTTPEDTQVQHLVTPMLLDHEDQGPLTATRVPMEVDKDSNSNAGMHNQSSGPTTSDGFYQSTTETSLYNSTPHSASANDSMMGTECVGLTSHHGSDDMKSDLHMLNMYGSTFSNVRTPLQTPQLSSSMSTPQIETPEQSLPTYGLGVHIPVTGIDMHFGAQSLLNQSTMAGISQSMPVATANGLPTSHPGTNAEGTSMSTNTQPDFHAKGSHADLNMHKLDSYPNIDIPSATSSSPYTACSAPSAHGMSGICDNMLTGMEVSMSMGLDMENGGAVAPNAMALHPFTWV